MFVSKEKAGQEAYKEKKSSCGIVHSGTCYVSCLHWFNILKDQAVDYRCLHGRGEYKHKYLLEENLTINQVQREGVSALYTLNVDRVNLKRFNVSDS